MPVYRDPIPGGITTIIQGPINEASLKNIPNYLQIGPVVVHAWNFDLKNQRPWRQAQIYREHLLEIKQKFEDRVKIVITPTPEESNHIEAIHAQRWRGWGRYFASQTFHFAMYGISDALKHVQTEYVLRTRSDEAYSNVDPFVEVLSRDPKKFVMGNIFAAPMKKQEFHIGDHIYACKSEDLYHATSQLASFYYGHSKDARWFYFENPFSPEQVLAHSWMDCVGIDTVTPLRPEGCEDTDIFKMSCPQVQQMILANSTPSTTEHRKIKEEILHEYFHVVDINRMSPFLARWQHSGKTYYNEFINPHKVNSLGDMLHGYI